MCVGGGGGGGGVVQTCVSCEPHAHSDAVQKGV